MKKNLKYTLIALFPIALYASDPTEDSSKIDPSPNMQHIQDLEENETYSDTFKLKEEIEPNYPLGLALNGDAGHDYALKAIIRDLDIPQNNQSELETNYIYDASIFQKLEECYPHHVGNSVWNMWRILLMDIARIDTNVYLINQGVRYAKSNSVDAEKALSSGEATYYVDFKIEALLLLLNKSPTDPFYKWGKKKTKSEEKEELQYKKMLEEAEELAHSELNKMTFIITYKSPYATRVIKKLNNHSNDLAENHVLHLIRDMARDPEHINAIWALHQLNDFKNPENQKILESTTENLAKNIRHRKAAEAGIFLHQRGTEEKKQHAKMLLENIISEGGEEISKELPSETQSILIENICKAVKHLKYDPQNNPIIKDILDKERRKTTEDFLYVIHMFANPKKI